MTAKKLKLGIVGLGEQAVDNLLPSIILSKYVKLSAICDLDSEKLRSVGYHYRIPKRHRHTSYQNMLEKEDIDVVIVSSFPEIHYQVAKFSILKSIPVFVEKPPTSNKTQLLELVDLCKLKNVKTGVGMNFSYTDAQQILDNVISQTDFGKISFLSVEHISSKPNQPLWHLDSTLDSFMLAQLIHPLDYIMSLGGVVDSVDVYTSNHGIPFIIQVMIKFTNGTIGCLRSGTFHTRFNHNIELISTDGDMVRVRDLSTIEITKKGSQVPYNMKAKNCSTIYHPSPLKSGYTKAGYLSALNNFFEHLLFGRKYAHSFADMVPVYNTMERIKDQVIWSNSVVEMPNLRFVSNLSKSIS